MFRAAVLTVLLAPALPAAAYAQATPERAASLQAQLKDWLQSTLGDGIRADKAPVTVTAAGDHYDLAMPLGSSAGAPIMTGKMTDAGSGRWAIDDVKIPSPSTFRYQLPTQTKPGAATVGGEVVSTLTLGRQEQRMLIDPTFATPSTFASSIGDMGLTTQITGGTQISHVDTGVGSSTITPTTADRVNVAMDSTLQGYTIKMSGKPDQAPLAISMGSVSVVSSFTGVSRERGLEVVRVLSRLSQANTADKTAGTKVPPMDRETSLKLLSALADLATSGTIDEKLNDLTVTTQGMTGTLKQMALAFTSKVEDGKLLAQMPLSAEGLTLPDLGLGSMAQLIPTKLTLTPTLSSVPTTAVMQISKKLADQQDPNDQDYAALFSQGPINAGIDNFHLDVAGSSFAGNVKMLVSSRNTFSGTGQITAENIDRLQQAMSANPQTAQMAPLIIFLKGIGRSEQSRMVWDVVYRDGKLVVNGQDMAALMGGPPPAARQGAAPNRPPQRPAAPRP